MGWLGRTASSSGASSVADSCGSSMAIMGFRIGRKRVFAATYALLGVFALITNAPVGMHAGLRRGLAMATVCIHNIYATEQQALSMPPVPEPGAGYIPSYIKICYEWLRRDALSTGTFIEDKFLVHENRDICIDWTAPHYAMLEIVASSILNTILPRIRYKHQCPSWRTWDEGILGFDWTPFQTVFQEPAMAVDQELVLVQQFEDQCKVALAAYDPAMNAGRIRPRVLHHPFAFPEESLMYTNPLYQLVPVSERTELTWLPKFPSLAQPNLAPMSAITRPLRNRLYHSAWEWANVTDAPPNEEFGGTVIFIDSGSYAIPFDVFRDYIPDTVTSIAVITGPLCVVSNLPTGEHCLTYGKNLANYLEEQFPQTAGGGFKGGPGVALQISGSTAGTWSRGMIASNLLCPPNTFSCLLPAFGRKGPGAGDGTYLFDRPPSSAAAKFFDKVGTQDTVRVIQLPIDVNIVEATDNAPAPVPIDSTISTEPVAAAFIQAQEPVVGDGYPASSPPPPSIDYEAAVAQTSATAYKDVEQQFPQEVQEASTGDASETSPLASSENTFVNDNKETVPTPEEVDTAVANGDPIDSNTLALSESELEGATPEEAAGELASFTDSNLETSTLDSTNYMDLAVERRDSKERIINGTDGNFLYEIYCPEENAVGEQITVDGGFTITSDPEAQIVIVSDTVGTVTFQEPVTIQTVLPEYGLVTDPITDQTYEAFYIELDDPISNTPIIVTSTTVEAVNSDYQVTSSISSLYTDPNTGAGTLLLDGTAGSIADSEHTHTLITGTVLTTGNHNVETSSTGTTTMTSDGGFQVTGSETLAESGTTDGSSFQSSDPSATYIAPEHQYQKVEPATTTTGQDVVAVELLPHPFIDDKCIWSEKENPIYIRSFDTTTVTFDVYQMWKGLDSISWVAVDIVDPSGQPACKKINEVSYGAHGGLSGFTAQCVDRYANVDVYIHDGALDQTKKGGVNAQTDNADITGSIPGRCEPSKDIGKKCAFSYRVSCEQPLSSGRRLMAIGPAEGDFPFGQSVFRNCKKRLEKRGEKVIFNNYIFGGVKKEGIKEGINAASPTSSVQ